MKKKFELYLKNSNIKSEIIKKIHEINPDFEYSPDNFNYLITCGGDGTYIDLLKQNFSQQINLLLFPTGNLNFFSSDFNLINNEWQEFSLLEIWIDNQKFYAINDFMIIKIGGTAIYNLGINDFNFIKTQSSGFLINTSLGSTGVNRSLNGPLFFDQNIYCLHELMVAKHNKNTFLDQPIILDYQNIINIYNVEDNCDFTYKIDGNEFQITNWKHICIKLIKSCAKINLSYLSWLKKIQTKLI